MVSDVLNHLAAGGSRNYGTKIEIQNGYVGYLRTYTIYSIMFWGQRNVCMGAMPPTPPIRTTLHGKLEEWRFSGYDDPCDWWWAY